MYVHIMCCKQTLKRTVWSYLKHVNTHLTEQLTLTVGNWTVSHTLSPQIPNCGTLCAFPNTTRRGFGWHTALMYETVEQNLEFDSRQILIQNIGCLVSLTFYTTSSNSDSRLGRVTSPWITDSPSPESAENISLFGRNLDWCHPIGHLALAHLHFQTQFSPPLFS